MTPAPPAQPPDQPPPLPDTGASECDERAGSAATADDEYEPL